MTTCTQIGRASCTRPAPPATSLAVSCAGDRLARWKAGSASRREQPAEKSEDRRADDSEELDRNGKPDGNGDETLAAEVTVDDDGDDLGEGEPEQGADDAAGESDRARFDDEGPQDVTIARADGLEHPDLPAPFPHGREHGVGDTDRRDAQCNRADPPEDDLDDVEIPTYGRNEVLGRRGGVGDGSDRVGNGGNRVGPDGDGEDAAVRREGVGGGVVMRTCG